MESVKNDAILCSNNISNFLNLDFIILIGPDPESGANPFEGNLILTTATFLMIYQLLIR